ncbi:hypothetical protein K505DRAFT_373062 [Melanomma pulvis-pyrius CBS 109.77]|uniref:Complex I intermediate-associated protein-like protein 84 n=1 Tax=Melanomma pulvis-pyrius CBS 109.77 TaxID=1314802 RepID=A0A6A6XKH2_9PLEO|nr:hypothetical protein K505DRAFT_373062 [Melanomma pulvis-pyrius CBS 109.77]
MPSHLTRVVFRSIVANTPLLYRGCLHRAPRPRIALQHGRRSLLPAQRRTFLNFLKPQRKVKDAELPPGLEKLMELVRMQDLAARPPPPSEVASAFSVFLSQKGIVLEDFHVGIIDNAYRYLQEHPREDGQPWLSLPQIRTANLALARPPSTGGKPHLAFGRILHEDLGKRQEQGVTGTTEHLQTAHAHDLAQFIKLLSLHGSSLEARDIAAKAFSGPLDPRGAKEEKQTVRWAWEHVLKGFARENNEEELLKTANFMRERSVPFTSQMQSVLVTFFAQKPDLEQTKYWYSQPVIAPNDKERSPRASTYAAILKACALSGDLTFGQQVVASLLKNTPNKAAWDAIFIWSAAIGKGVDEVDRMMNVMVRRNAESGQQETHPDIDTINDLVEFSMAKRDPYSAERYITLGEKRGILPNEKTFTMQMQYRLSTKDVDGAKAAYFGLQGNLTSDEKSIEVINQLIQALCESKYQQFEEIMAIVDDLHERKAKLTPETVAALCILHLRRGEAIDAMDVLQVHVHHYSPPQRAMIYEQLVKFLLDGQNSTADAWDTYQILRQVFPETPRGDRIRVMNEFFARRRSDMACHVFFHMRNHDHPSVSANKDVYTAAFTGFARNADAESLELAHNQLKLDLGVEMDTKIRNSLMLAYAATGNNKRALEFWSEIVASEEGPTYNSIAIAFRSCEGMPFGDEHAKPIWRRLKQMDLEIDKQIFTAYLGAIARNQLHDEAVSMLETVEEEYGFTPDLFILGNWFNATANIDRQTRVETWIKEHYPTVWTELDALGHWVEMDGFGYRQYNISRDLDP